MPGGVTRAQPRALAYAQITANQTGIGLSATDSTGLSITFTPGSRPVWVEFQAVSLIQNTSTGQPILFVTDSSNNEVIRAVVPSLVAGASTGPVSAKRRLTILTPGTSYTFKVRGQTTAGTFDLRANVDAIPTVNGPAYLRAYEE
jgi:hypothetical protein